MRAYTNLGVGFRRMGCGWGRMWGSSAEGLLGAARLAPFGVALKGDQRRFATLSNPACLSVGGSN